jgi:hypothetical protein
LSGCPECPFTGQREPIGREPDAQTNPTGISPREVERGVTKPGTASEADSILQAETEGKVVGEARRTDPALGEPDLDFRMVAPATNKPLGYVDIKTPVSASTRPIPEQALNIANKIKRYDPDVEVIVDLKNLGPDRADFVTELAKNGVVDGGAIKFLNK